MRLFCVCVAAAYKHSDGKKIDGRRIVVDVERGRTVKTWKPRRLGECMVICTIKPGSNEDDSWLS